MGNTRQIAWIYLLPRSTEYHLSSRLRGLQDLLAPYSIASAKHKTLVTLGSELPHHSDLTGYQAIVVLRPKNPNGGALASLGFNTIRRYAILPSIDDPRWFIPTDSARAAAGSFALYAPFKPLARMKHFGVKLAARAGQANRYGDEILIALRSNGHLDRIARIAFDEQEYYYAISTGTPGPTRKPSLALINRSGHFQGIIKIADQHLTRQMLIQEATTLKALSRNPGLGQRIPILRFAGDIDERYYTAQTILRGRTAPASIAPQHVDFIAALNHGTKKSTLSSTMMQQLFSRSDAARRAEVDLASLTHSIRQLLGHSEVEATVNHGDFAPWNLREHRGQIGAFDWEYAELDGLPLIDELHFRFQVGYLLRGWTDAEGMALMRHMSISQPLMSPEQVQGIQLAYLANALFKRVEEGYSGNDPLLQRYHRLLVMRLAQ